MKKQILLFCFLFFAMIGFAENVNIKELLLLPKTVSR